MLEAHHFSHLVEESRLRFAVLRGKQYRLLGPRRPREHSRSSHNLRPWSAQAVARNVRSGYSAGHGRRSQRRQPLRQAKPATRSRLLLRLKVAESSLDGMASSEIAGCFVAIGCGIAGAFAVGIPAYLLGVNYAIAHYPESPQSPFLGVFVTGPAGAFVGFVAGALLSQLRKRK